MRVLILIITVLFSKICFSQSIEKWVFLIESREGENSFGKNVYLTKNDSILEVNPIDEEGEFSFEIDGDLAIQDLFIAFRQSENSIYRLNLQNFKDGKGMVVLSNMTIGLKKVLQINHQTNVFPLADRRFYQRLDRLNSSIDECGDYFPVEKLKLSHSHYRNLIEKRLDIELFKKVFGHYPTERELDSLADIESENEVREIADWLNNRLFVLEEPILSCGNKQQVIRFTWCKNREIYTYVPYCIRIEPSNQKGALMFVSYILWDTCEENLLYHDIIPIDDSTYNNIVDMGKGIVSNDNLSMYDQGGMNNIFEMYSNNQYHVIFRGDGEDEGMEELRRFLWDLTGLGENKIVHKRQRIE